MAYLKIHDKVVFKDLRVDTVWPFEWQFEEEDTMLKELPHPLLPGFEMLLCLRDYSVDGLKEPELMLSAWFVDGRESCSAKWRVCLLAEDDTEVCSVVSEMAEIGPDPHSDGEKRIYLSAFTPIVVRSALHGDGSIKLSVDLTVKIPFSAFDNPTSQFLKPLLDKRVFPDFHIVVGGESFGVHRCVLGVKSAVFAAMFENRMAERSQNTATLDDTNRRAFKAFLGAIYGNDYTFLRYKQLTQDVLYLAEKYGLDDMKALCDASLSESVNATNALPTLTACAAFCDAKFAKAACLEILSNHLEFLESEMWLNFQEAHVPIAAALVADIGKLFDLREAKTANQKRMRAIEADRGHARCRGKRRKALGEYRLQEARKRLR